MAGCLDVDLESSALTNAFPIHRLQLPPGEEASAPATYVRIDLSVGRLEQGYRRASDEGARRRYDYSAPEFEVAWSLSATNRGSCSNTPASPSAPCDPPSSLNTDGIYPGFTRETGRYRT